jgi:uncharacterized protein (TIGR02421 family)
MAGDEELSALDDQVVRAASKVKVLSSLSWPEEAVESFLESVRSGAPRPPAPVEVPRVAPEVVEALGDAERRADAGHPAGRLVRETAESYRLAADMLASAGSAAFHARSRELYGGPRDRLSGTDQTHLEVADRLIAATAELTTATQDDVADYCLSAEHVARELRRAMDAFFVHDRIDIVVDPTLSAKAAASATRVRLRGRTCFSESDVKQLLEHELFVHTATALNGRRQPALKVLGLGAPRTTATQEGLATFAELVTGAIDLARLRRMALRIRAVHLAEEGADFVDVFRFFLDAGQSEEESAHSTVRVFRGSNPRGRHPFTKDVVYLRGLLGVHTFLRKAVAERRPGLIARLFVGRLTVSDVLRLEPAFDEGLIAPARYVPAWAKNVRGLAAYLSFSVLLNQIDLEQVTLAELLRD